MDIVLVPGFWLDGSSWDAVTPSLERAGHRTVALTLPGLESEDSDRSGIRLSDHVAAVVEAIDRLSGDVVLVGHSGGGPIAHGAADARPDRVRRMVHVDTWPLTHGRCVNDELPVIDASITRPDWSVFEPEDLVDLDDGLKAMFRARAVPEPAAVASDPQVLTDDRRHDIPTTIVCCEFTGEQLRGWMAGGAPQLAELALMRDVEYVDLPTGHWPQFTRPDDLAAVILAAIERR